jgi:hexosaminidase
MPEIDLPAHSWALLQIMPELYDYTSNIKSEDVGNYKNNTINPALPETWEFLEKTIEEISDLFTYSVVHVGLDERPNSAWEGSQKITEMMKEKNLLSYEEVQDFYMNKVINILNTRNKITAAWNEAALSPHKDIGSGGSSGNIDKNCLIFAWEHPDIALAAAKKGFQTIMCPGQKTYFDMAHNNSTEERGICWAATIEVAEIHSWKPLQDIDNNLHNLILGIQGQLWSETLTDKSFLDQMINPRLATLAEVAWSSDERRGWGQFRSALLNGVKLLEKIGWKYHEF